MWNIEHLYSIYVSIYLIFIEFTGKPKRKPYLYHSREKENIRKEQTPKYVFND